MVHMVKALTSVSCAARVTSHTSPRGEYARAIPETGYISLVMLAKGLENSAYVLLRQCIELALKHVYFSTHPVEYSWTQDSPGYREVTYHLLTEYVRKLGPEAVLGVRPCPLTRLEHWYGECSRHVHVHSGRFLSLGQQSAGTATRKGLCMRFDRAAHDVWTTISLLLVGSFRRQFDASSELEKRVIVQALPRRFARAIAARHAARQTT